MSHQIHSRLPADNLYTDKAGKQVLVKGNGVTTVSDEDLEHLTQNRVFKQHVSNKFVKIKAVPLPPAPEEESNDSGGPDTTSDTMLLGSETQPASFDLADGTTVQLGDVVKTAYEESEKTVKQWNKLSQKTRESAIADVVANLSLKED